MRYRPVTTSNIEDIDRALTLVGGCRSAAAKILDLEPRKLRNLIGHHAALKEKWSYPRCGRPKVAQFRIDPVEFRVPSVGTIMGLIGLLPSDERAELAEWMNAQNRQT